MPEPFVAVRHQFAIGRQLLQGRLLEHGVVRKIVERAALEYEKPAVDPTAARLRFLGKVLHTIAVDVQRAKARGRTYCSDGRKTPVRAMEIKQSFDLDIGDAIAVSREKTWAGENFFQPQDTPSRRRV